MNHCAQRGGNSLVLKGRQLQLHSWDRSQKSTQRRYRFLIGNSR